MTAMQSTTPTGSKTQNAQTSAPTPTPTSAAPTPTPTAASSTNNTTKTTKKKKPTKSGKSSKKKSKAGKNEKNSASQLGTQARLQYKKLIQERQTRSRDGVWLSSHPNTHANANAHAHPATAAAAAATAGVNTNEQGQIQSPAFLEQDFEIIHRALKNNGLEMEDVTAQGFDTLLQEARRYAMQLITDAGDYALHSHGTDNINPADLILAKEMMQEDDHHTTTGGGGGNSASMEHLSMLGMIAHDTNRRILPPIPEHCYNGVVLPELEYTLLGRSFDVICREPEQRSVASLPNGAGTGTLHNTNVASVTGMNGNEMADSKTSKRQKPIYGAKRGQKQVQISLKNNGL